MNGQQVEQLCLVKENFLSFFSSACHMGLICKTSEKVLRTLEISVRVLTVTVPSNQVGLILCSLRMH